MEMYVFSSAVTTYQKEVFLFDKQRIHDKQIFKQN